MSEEFINDIADALEECALCKKSTMLLGYKHTRDYLDEPIWEILCPICGSASEGNSVVSVMAQWNSDNIRPGMRLHFDSELHAIQMLETLKRWFHGKH